MGVGTVQGRGRLVVSARLQQAAGDARADRRKHGFGGRERRGVGRGVPLGVEQRMQGCAPSGVEPPMRRQLGFDPGAEFADGPGVQDRKDRLGQRPPGADPRRVERGEDLVDRGAAPGRQAARHLAQVLEPLGEHLLHLALGVVDPCQHPALQAHEP
jgi:hypothetical protein